MTPADRDAAFLAALGIKLDGPIPARLQREVAERHVATASDYHRYYREGYEDGKAVGQDMGHSNFVNLIWVAANGWGTYDDFVQWLKKYLEACREHPEAKIRARR